MTTTVKPATLLDRLDDALAAAERADEADRAQADYEQEHGPNPGGWEAVDIQRINAGDTALAVLADARPILAAWDALALILQDRDEDGRVGYVTFYPRWLPENDPGWYEGTAQGETCLADADRLTREDAATPEAFAAWLTAHGIPAVVHV